MAKKNLQNSDKNGDQTPNREDPGQGPPDVEVAEMELGEEGTGTILDEFGGLEGGGLDELRVKITRLEGKFDDGSDATGYLGTLPLLDVPDIENVIQRFGGGTLQIIVLRKGKYVRNYKFKSPYPARRLSLTNTPIATSQSSGTLDAERILQIQKQAQADSLANIKAMMELVPKPQSGGGTFQDAIALMNVIDERARRQADDLAGDDDDGEEGVMESMFGDLIRQAKHKILRRKTLDIASWVRDAVSAFQNGVTPEQIVSYIKSQYPEHIATIKGLELRDFVVHATAAGFDVDAELQAAFKKVQELL